MNIKGRVMAVNISEKKGVVKKPIEVGRITSYNVCYTKLLRSLPDIQWSLSEYAYSDHQHNW